MVLVQKWPFSQLFFLGNMGQGNVFYDILAQKNAFLSYKKKKFKKSKNCHFSNGVNPWFQSKMAIFPPFFFQAIQVSKMSFTIFQNEKTGFQALKTRSSNSRKIDIFPKGLTHRFRPKMAISPKIVLQAIQPRKISFTVFQIEKTAFQAIKTRNSRSRKIDIFPKGLIHGFGPKVPIFPTFFVQEIYARRMSFTTLQNEKTRFQAI